MIFLLQFGMNKHLQIFQTPNCTRPYGLEQFCESLKNLLVLIYSKLLSKSCDYHNNMMAIMNKAYFSGIEIPRCINDRGDLQLSSISVGKPSLHLLTSCILLHHRVSTGEKASDIVNLTPCERWYA